MSIRWYIGTLAALAAGVFFWCALSIPEGNDDTVVLAGKTMGTSWQVQLVATEDSASLDRLAAEIAVLLQRLDRDLFSTWTPDSELSHLNRGIVGEMWQLPDELAEVLVLAQMVHRRSEGAFDVTLGALVDLWGFGPEPVAGRPTAAAVRAARQRVGMEAFTLDPEAGTIVLHKALQFDLSGIAKGYAVDRVATLLQRAGHDNFLVEIGGELRLQGWRADGAAWVVAIEKPQSGLPEAFARLDSRGDALALAGSGDYRNVREYDGRRYSHEIDPRSGAPVDHALSAVTVLHESAALADAWATALMVLGPIEGPRIADREELAAYFIMRDASGLVSRQTSGFSRYITNTNRQ